MCSTLTPGREVQSKYWYAPLHLCDVTIEYKIECFYIFRRYYDKPAEWLMDNQDV
jgi:hypothetical protein